MTIIGNKLDLEHLRCVSREMATELANVSKFIWFLAVAVRWDIRGAVDKSMGGGSNHATQLKIDLYGFVVIRFQRKYKNSSAMS